MEMGPYLIPGATMWTFDPCLNIGPETVHHCQNGGAFVTADGAETWIRSTRSDSSTKHPNVTTVNCSENARSLARDQGEVEAGIGEAPSDTRSMLWSWERLSCTRQVIQNLDLECLDKAPLRECLAQEACDCRQTGSATRTIALIGKWPRRSRTSSTRSRSPARRSQRSSHMLVI
jgi:hypothetical protein